MAPEDVDFEAQSSMRVRGAWVRPPFPWLLVYSLFKGRRLARAPVSKEAMCVPGSCLVENTSKCLLSIVNGGSGHSILESRDPLWL